ncbi:MAG: hypothetical protein AB7O24_27210 [Kofleriaceae bacterium]
MKPFDGCAIRALALMVAASGAISCGADGNPDGNDNGVDAGDNGDNGNNPPGGEECSDEAKLVYVVDQNDQFSTFDPATKMFHTIGTLDCPAENGATPFSMGIDRTPTAWVLYDSGELFKVDTATVACTATNWTSQLGLEQFGMGFSTDTAGGTTDSLFIVGGPEGLQPTSVMATLDLNTMTATMAGTVQGNPELTGTGSAELWGWFPDDNAPRVEHVNKATGAPVQTFALPSLAGEPRAWAFAFWGGDFWIFLKRSNEASTTVHQIDGTTGEVKGSTPAPGRSIVGAGVSTCAPTVIF